MLRDYDSGKCDMATYFVGEEIEHTNNKGLRTLFVVGQEHSSLDIISVARANNCLHVYLGANQTYANETPDFEEVERLVEKITKAGLAVTVDVPCFVWDVFVRVVTPRAGLTINISVPLPNIEKYDMRSVNIKVDDADFNYSNPGVWVFNMDHNATKDKFTKWDEYTKDTIIS
tara:strand:+ start:112 stop:630 length:519 start_codon:yes stop_codon:yes gene_type:complete